MTILLKKDVDRWVAYIQGNAFELSLVDQDLGAQNDDLNAAADDLVATIRRSVSREDAAHRLLDPYHGLAARGHGALNRVLSAAALAFLRARLESSDDKAIDFSTDGFFVPWEWMYETPPQRILAENPSPDRILGSFWALDRAMGRRRIPRFGVRDELLPPPPVKRPPRVGVVVDTSLAFADREVAALANLHEAGQVTLSVLELPSGCDDWEIITRVNTFLVQSREILHFICHADFVQHNALTSYITVGQGRHYELGFLSLTPTVTNIGAALVILNACSTGIRRPSQTFDFVRAFWDRGVKNVIAVESAIETQVAERYASHLYTHLLNGEALGPAVQRSRLDVLRENDQASRSLCLFYALYGDLAFRL